MERTLMLPHSLDAGANAWLDVREYLGSGGN